MQIKRWHLSSSPQNSTVLDESKSSPLLFDIVSTTFIPGKISSEKKVSKLRQIAELRAFYGWSITKLVVEYHDKSNTCRICPALLGGNVSVIFPLRAKHKEPIPAHLLEDQFAEDRECTVVQSVGNYSPLKDKRGKQTMYSSGIKRVNCRAVIDREKKYR